MNEGRTIFSQLISFLPDREFRRCVTRYGGDSRLRGFSCWDQYLAMAFAQLTYRDSLRDIEACLRALGGKLYHLGFRGRVARSTLADANETHDWHIFADFAQVLIRIARPLYAQDPMGVDLDQSLYALDSTTIDLCLSLFPWAKFRRRKAAVKMHTLLDLHGNIPTFIRVTSGDVHDVNILDEIAPEAGAFYVMDRGYIDFDRLYVFTLSSAFFVVRAKSNILLQRRCSRPVDKSTGVRSDQTVILSSFQSASVYPDPLRKVSYVDAETDQRLVFLTNNFTLPALTIAQIYKQRWQVELFFKWIKQHLRIKAFYGTSYNAVKTQIWIAVSVYVLVAIIRKRLGLKASLYQILQILSVTLFEKTPILRALQTTDPQFDLPNSDNQLNLFSL
ncbi:MAG TPA: IS4 family transposase [Steroidobacteraceae bacterium]